MKFLVVVDMQYDFVMSDGKLPVPEAEELIVPMTKFLSKLNPKEYSGILYTYDLHDKNEFFDSEESKEFPIHCEENTYGSEHVLPALWASTIPEYQITKSQFSMWGDHTSHVQGNDDEGNAHYRGELKTFIQHRLYAGDEIVVIGIASDYCVKYAIQGFLDRGFKVSAIADLCKGIHRTIEEVNEQDFQGRVNIL